MLLGISPELIIWGGGGAPSLDMSWNSRIRFEVVAHQRHRPRLGGERLCGRDSPRTAERVGARAALVA